MVVGTPDGAWVVPPERGVWIPAGIPHSVRMVGVVNIRSVLVEPEKCPTRGRTCEVVGVSALLRQLLVTAAELAQGHEDDERSELVMRLLTCEVDRALRIPLAVPFPAHRKLAKRCHAFLDDPKAGATIDEWADAMAMNRRTFTRLFRRETGMSFTAWRQQACMSVALTKLAAGESVTAVAIDLGYDGPSNFSTVFKKVLGVAPSKYRPPST